MDAALNHYSPPGAQTLESFILASIRGRVGEESAISTSSLTSQASVLLGRSVDERTIRDTIHAMRQLGSLGALICSCTAGYYFPCSLEDAFESIRRQFRVPATDELKTARAMRAAARNYFGGQGRLF